MGALVVGGAATATAPVAGGAVWAEVSVCTATSTVGGVAGGCAYSIEIRAVPSVGTGLTISWALVCARSSRRVGACSGEELSLTDPCAPSVGWGLSSKYGVQLSQYLTPWRCSL